MVTSVSNGNLDALLGKTFTSHDLVQATATAIDGTVTNPGLPSGNLVYTLNGVTETIGIPFDGSIGSTYKIIGFSNTDNSLTFAQYYKGAPIVQFTFFVVGFSQDAIALSAADQRTLVFVSDAPSTTDGIMFALGVGLDASLSKSLIFDETGQYLVPSIFTGTAKNDTLVGTDDADTLYGLAGKDSLKGNGGDDILNGGAGNDILLGGAGRDKLTGASGADKFVFAGGDFGGATKASADVITDFKHAQGDRIDLSAVDANSLVAGDQAFTFIGKATFGGHAGELRYSVVGGSAVVLGDTNGDAHADFAILLTKVTALVAGDFLL